MGVHKIVTYKVERLENELRNEKLTKENNVARSKAQIFRREYRAEIQHTPYVQGNFNEYRDTAPQSKELIIEENP